MCLVVEKRKTLLFSQMNDLENWKLVEFLCWVKRWKERWHNRRRQRQKQASFMNFNSHYYYSYDYDYFQWSFKTISCFVSLLTKKWLRLPIWPESKERERDTHTHGERERKRERFRESWLHRKTQTHSRWLITVWDPFGCRTKTKSRERGSTVVDFLLHHVALRPRFYFCPFLSLLLSLAHSRSWRPEMSLQVIMICFSCDLRAFCPCVGAHGLQEVQNNTTLWALLK